MTANHETPNARVPAVPSRPGAPLNPMPPAGAEEGARWLRRVRRGPICLLAVVCLSFLWTAVNALGFAPPWPGALVHAAVVAILLIVGLWLLTEPEPQRPSWLRGTRRAVRIGIPLAYAVWFGFYGTIGFPNLREDAPVPHAPSVDAADLLVLAVAAWPMLDCAWYPMELSARLRDGVLRVNFKVFLIVLAVLVGLGLLGGILEFATWYIPGGEGMGHPAAYDMPPRTRPISDADPTFRGTLRGFILGPLLSATVTGWLVWIQIRLLRRLTFAARKLDGMLPDGNAPAEGGEGG